MGKTAVGLYETSAEAQGVLNELVSAGFGRSKIRIMLGDNTTRGLYEWDENLPDNGQGERSQWANGGATTALLSMGVPRDDAEDYEEALHHGHALVSVETTGQRIDKAVDIMSHHDMVDLYGRKLDWQKTASTGTAAASAASAAAGKSRTLKGDEEATE
ncbi:MAG: general stress protein [Caldilineaceae bacterium]|nr:general stress protein [Caldilineaceae bacterium]